MMNIYSKSSIRVSSQLTMICWKPKYLKTLLEIAFKEAALGEELIFTRDEIFCKKYLETKENAERRQSLDWLVKHGLIRMAKDRGVYGISLTPYAKTFIRFEGGKHE